MWPAVGDGTAVSGRLLRSVADAAVPDGNYGVCRTCGAVSALCCVSVSAAAEVERLLCVWRAGFPLSEISGR